MNAFGLDIEGDLSNNDDLPHYMLMWARYNCANEGVRMVNGKPAPNYDNGGATMWGIAAKYNPSWASQLESGKFTFDDAVSIAYNKYLEPLVSKHRTSAGLYLQFVNSMQGYTPFYHYLTGFAYDRNNVRGITRDYLREPRGRGAVKYCERVLQTLSLSDLIDIVNDFVNNFSSVVDDYWDKNKRIRVGNSKSGILRKNKFYFSPFYEDIDYAALKLNNYGYILSSVNREVEASTFLKGGQYYASNIGNTGNPGHPIKEVFV